jgi:glycosyltransferase involved in cell wall biosynthesis
MRIAVATVQVPFVTGGAELHADGLCQALRSAGHDVELIRIPFKWYPPDRLVDAMMVCRMLDLTEACGTRIDRLIALKFPAYYIPHPCKVTWLLHQHRSAYDFWGHEFGDLHRFPDGPVVRDLIVKGDRKSLPESRLLFANSSTVANRLSRYCGIAAKPLFHPPPLDSQLMCRPAEDFFFYPSRLTPVKRQQLVIEALRFTRHQVRVRFCGVADTQDYQQCLWDSAKHLGVSHRVEFLGLISDAAKVDNYARCLGVIYPPMDEDYGYVTLESMLASKPLITCSDSGGPLEFAVAGLTGLIADPTPEALGGAMDMLWQDRERSAGMGRAALERYRHLGISWSSVVEQLLA